MNQRKPGREPAPRTAEAIAAALTITCPVCRAEPGRRCHRNGHSPVPIHSGRIDEAARRG